MHLAIVSVSDKSGLIPFIQGLQDLDWEFIGSGGTAQMLRGAGIQIQDVADYTSSPEILDGRVKTLHPKISGGILAKEKDTHAADLRLINAKFIDMVVCNLYPFEQTIKDPDSTINDAIDNIDIGGVTLIRAAAKNFPRVVVLTDPTDYKQVLSELGAEQQVSSETRSKLAVKAFKLTAAYDSAICNYLSHLSLR